MKHDPCVSNAVCSRSSGHRTSVAISATASLLCAFHPPFTLLSSFIFHACAQDGRITNRTLNSELATPRAVLLKVHAGLARLLSPIVKTRHSYLTSTFSSDLRPVPIDMLSLARFSMYTAYYATVYDAADGVDASSSASS